MSDQSARKNIQEFFYGDMSIFLNVAHTHDLLHVVFLKKNRMQQAVPSQRNLKW